MRTIDLIPNCILDLPERRDESHVCADCGAAITLHENSVFVELRWFDGSKPWGERSTLFGRACLPCAEKRNRAALAEAREHGKSWHGYVSGNAEYIGGIRMICDGEGERLLTVTSVYGTKRLPSGDTMSNVRAADDTGRIWYGRARSLGYGTTFITLRPVKQA